MSGAGRAARRIRQLAWRGAKAVHRQAMARVPVAYVLLHFGRQILTGWAKASPLGPWWGTGRDLRTHYRRTSDTLFVLGSGSSVCDLPAGAWDEIAAADSIGINFWVLHQFVPSAYTTEWYTNDDKRTAWLEAVDARRDEIAEVPIFFRLPARRVNDRQRGSLRLRPADVTARLPAWHRKTRITNDLNILPIRPVHLRRLFRTFDRIGLLNHRRRTVYLPVARGTVLWAIFFGYRLGYRRIVLCGVDLNHTEYFFHRPGGGRVEGLRVPAPYQHGERHRTDDPSLKGSPMSALVAAVNDAVLAPHGIRLEVGHPRSALAEFLPLHEWSSGDREPADPALAHPNAARP